MWLRHRWRACRRTTHRWASRSPRLRSSAARRAAQVVTRTDQRDLDTRRRDLATSVAGATRSSVTTTLLAQRRSRNDAVLDERLEGVDRAAAAGAHLEVEVGAGDVAGGADGADVLAAVDAVADGDVDRGLVAVPDLGAVIEGDDGLVAVGPVVAGLGDGAVGDRQDRVTGVTVEVEAGVVVGPEAVLAEGGGDAVVREGENPLVLLDLRRLLLRGVAHLLELGGPLGHLLLGERDELGVGLLVARVAGVVATHDDAAAGDRLAGDRADGLRGLDRGTRRGQRGDARAGPAEGSAGGDRQHGDTSDEGQGREPDHGASRRVACRSRVQALPRCGAGERAPLGGCPWRSYQSAGSSGGSGRLDRARL